MPGLRNGCFTAETQVVGIIHLPFSACVVIQGVEVSDTCGAHGTLVKCVYILIIYEIVLPHYDRSSFSYLRNCLFILLLLGW